MFHGTSSNYEIHKYFLKILSKSKLSCYLMTATCDHLPAGTEIGECCVL